MVPTLSHASPRPRNRHRNRRRQCYLRKQRLITRKSDRSALTCQGWSLEIPQLHPNTSRKNKVILFQAGRRIGQVSIAQSQLPANSPGDVSEKRCVEVDSLLAGVTEVWKDEELFLKQHARVDSMD